MASDMRIGDAARSTGIKVPTIRYYEEIGLLKRAPRTSSNRRMYDVEDVRRLRFIRHARDLGFDIQAVRELIALARHPEEPCERADDIARARLAEVERKLVRLKGLRREFRAMISEGTHGSIRECRVIEVLAGDDG